MGAPRVRKKQFAHKVRSGCGSCKKRHVKCDEEKPICRRCRLAGFECIYNVPKPWTFDPSPSGDEKGVAVYKSSTPASEGSFEVPSSLAPYFGTADEDLALQHWLRVTGPWLANYTSPENKILYQKIIPRVAFSLPATKHMLVAVAMIDERIKDPTPQDLVSRSRKILTHYNTAISKLTANTPANLDLVVAPIIGWILEIMLSNGENARMHLQASERLADRLEQEDLLEQGSEAFEILSKNLRSAQRACRGYDLTQYSRGDGVNSTPQTVFQTVLARHGPQDIESVAQAREAFTSYFTKYAPDSGTVLAIDESMAYFRHWEIALLKYRRVSTDAHENIIAAHLLFNLAFALIPRTIDQGAEQYQDITGMDYILSKASDLSQTIGLSSKDRSNMEETLRLLLTTVIRFAQEKRHVAEAARLLEKALTFDDLSEGSQSVQGSSSASSGVT